MFGFPNHPALRDSILRGEVFGPRLYVAGPAMTGQSVHSPEEGAQKVREYNSGAGESDATFAFMGERGTVPSRNQTYSRKTL